MNCTTVEQSKKLLELGVNINTADSIRYSDNTFAEGALASFNGRIEPTPYKNVSDAYKDSIAPIWSLSALIDLFPCGKEDPIFELTRGGWSNRSYSCDWFAQYEDEHSNLLCMSNASNPVDAVFNLIVELKEKKLI